MVSECCITLDPVPTYSWIVALGVWKTDCSGRLSLPCIPFSALRAFLLIVVPSLWANINLSRMTEVTNIILLEAVGWGIGTPCRAVAVVQQDAATGASSALHHRGAETASRPQGGCHHA